MLDIVCVSSEAWTWTGISFQYIILILVIIFSALRIVNINIFARKVFLIVSQRYYMFGVVKAIGYSPGLLLGLN